MRRATSTLAVLLCLLSLPVFGADCPNPIKSLTAPDGQTGTAIRLQWNLGGVVPQSQTLTGSDFDEPVVVPPGLTVYPYAPASPGQKQVTLTVVTECGTFSREEKYHVQQCNVVQPLITADKTTVEPGGTITASVEVPPGHRVRWAAVNGTVSATTGESIQVTAGNTGIVRIDAFLARGDESSNSCEARGSANVRIVPACSISEPQIYSFPDPPAANQTFTVFVPGVGPGETFTYSVTGAPVLYNQPPYLDVMAPETGSFTVDVNVTKAGCSRTFSRTYEVTPCAPTATISAVTDGSCDSGTIVADFTGTAPFQGYWSDGQYFYTMDSRIERTVTTPGNYTLVWFMDGRCSGAVSGEAVVGAGLPTPSFTIDDAANGFYYGNNTCPGLERTATLAAPAPAGAQVIWSIENGTIVSGQGTATIHWYGNNPGQTTLSAVFQNAEGCRSAPYNYPYVTTQGVPEIAVTVEPSTIDAGGTAIVKLTRLNNFITGSGLTSSLGDNIVPIGPVDELTYAYEYRSTFGAGVATITAHASNMCGQSTSAQTTLTVQQGAPITATATIRQYGTNCTDYGAYAEMRGVAPFSGTWSNGTAFVSDSPYVYLYPIAPGTFTITDFSDANGPGTVSGSATFDYTEVPAPQIAFSAETACPNTTVTANITTPVPDGTTVEWFVSGGTILSGQGTSSIQIQLGEYSPSVNARIVGPGTCSPYGFNFLQVTSQYVQQPLFTLYGVYVNSSTEFWVTLDPNTATWAFENSMGDLMEVVGTPQPNTYAIRYTSSHGTGQSNIRIYGTTHCGTQFEATGVMNVLPPPPTVTISSAYGETCGAVVTATLTGIAPFTVEWWGNGETVTTSENTVTLFVPNSTYMYAIVTDATGTRVGGNYIYVETKPMPYISVGSYGYVCPNATTTVTAYDVPAGAEIIWSVDTPNGRIVSGQGTSELVVEGLEPGWMQVSFRYRLAGGCEGYGSGAFIQVLAPQANPVITLPVATIKAGETLDFTAAFDGNYQSLGWESSNGDPIGSQGQNGMTFNLRYFSQNGPGTATIRVFGTTLCGQQVEATATITITE